MSSESQITANRDNAALSTGPKTEIGKQRAAANSRKHGFTGRTVIVAPEDAAEFESLATSLQQALNPAGPLETEMFGEILHAAWTQRRIDRAEAALASQTPGGVDPLQDPAALKTLSLYSLYRTRARRAHDSAMKQLRELQKQTHAIARAKPIAIAKNLRARFAMVRQNRPQPPAYERTQFPPPPAPANAPLHGVR